MTIPDVVEPRPFLSFTPTTPTHQRWQNRPRYRPPVLHVYRSEVVTLLEAAQRNRPVAVPAAEAPLGGASAPTSFRWRPRRQRAPRRPQRRLRQAPAAAMAAARRTRRRWMPRRLRRGRRRWTTAALKMSAELKTKAEAKKRRGGVRYVNAPHSCNNNKVN